MRLKCFARERNTVPWPRLEPGSLDPESSALTIRPPRLTGVGRGLIYFSQSIPLLREGLFEVKNAVFVCGWNNVHASADLSHIQETRA